MIATILRIFLFFWDIRKTGFYEVVTPFTYQPNNVTFTFRTVIYLDADFYNFVPNMQKITTEVHDTDFQEFYQQCYTQHIQKIHDFIKGMDSGTNFWGNILIIPLLVGLNINVFVDIYQWIVSGIVPDFATDFIVFWETGVPSKQLLSLFLNILILTGAFSLRSFLVKIAVKLLLRIGFFTAKVYKKRKQKKNLVAAKKYSKK